jgi:hypothetical protein
MPERPSQATVERELALGGNNPGWKLHWDSRSITCCQADSDGDCEWVGCPVHSIGLQVKTIDVFTHLPDWHISTPVIT